MAYNPVEHLREFLQSGTEQIHYNDASAKLVELALDNSEGCLSSSGALVVSTGKYTGRSPKDKYIVDSPATTDRIDWGSVNQKMSEDVFNALFEQALNSIGTRPTYVITGVAGHSDHDALSVTIVCEYAWHALFARDLFSQGDGIEFDSLESFQILCIPSFKAEPKVHGVRSEVVVALDLERKIALITGTEYAGEIKKSAFTAMNYHFPLNGILTMHCSANVGKKGDTALFFGLSGTGKTTLSADGHRTLVGDDEHGWSHKGTFNLEGGCYAKCVGLERESEPQIYDAIRFASVLENVVIDATSRTCNYSDISLTENTRAAYPLSFIPSSATSRDSGHPTTIFLLTADATGVLPPIAQLTHAQTLYYFLSGYTSKLAGTERGVVSPEPNFSSCFGSPFWPLPPNCYAEMLGKKLSEHDVACYLVNTGWINGPYGDGERIPLAHTRSIIQAALAGKIQPTLTDPDPIFGLRVPKHVSDVPTSILKPETSWSDPLAYQTAAHSLATAFKRNFEKFSGVSANLSDAGPLG